MADRPWTTDEQLMVKRAEGVARDEHAGQLDKAGEPYITHPARVAARVGDDAAAVAVAWLHDTLEDTHATAGYLRETMEMPDEVVAAVEAMTHYDGQTNEEYWAQVRANPLARKVKVEGDIADNLDPDRLARLDEPTRARLEAKYARALEALG